MSFLAPAFLLATALIAIPFWLHRLQAQSADRKAFSSAMLLETARQQVHVRRKLKYWLLLAARVLLLLLIALAFAKPFRTLPPDNVVASDAGSLLVVVDTSASMARTGVFNQAQSQAERIIDDAASDALVQVAAADNALRLTGDLGIDHGASIAALSELRPSTLRLDFGSMMAAIERQAAILPAPVAVHIISDFQPSAFPVRFADLVVSNVASLQPHPVGSGSPFNWSIEFVREQVGGIDVGIRGSGDSERPADLSLIVNGEPVERRGVTGSGLQVINFALPEFEPGENRIELQLFSDDDLSIDNRWYQVVDNSPRDDVPIITANPQGLPLTYLTAALESSGEYRALPLETGEFDSRVLSRYPWAIIDDIGVVDVTLEESLRSYVDGGGNVLAFAGERAAALESLPLTGHRQPAASVQTPGSGFWSIGQVDTRHPLLAGTDNWQSVNVSRSLLLVPQNDDEVLIRLQNNDPFLIERRREQGRIMLLSAALNNRWNDFPVKSVFVSFMIEAARYLSGTQEVSRAYTAGSALPLNLTAGGSGQVIDPNGNPMLSLNATQSDSTRRDQQILLDRPGFYEVYTQDGERVVAVNIDTRESDISAPDRELLNRWQDATGSNGIAAGSSEFAAAERTLELWHWVLLGLLILVVAESLLGNLFMSPTTSLRAEQA